MLGEEQWAEGQPTSDEPMVENISGIDGMTSSGRIFMPPILMKDGGGNSESVMTKKAKELLKGKTMQTNEGLKKDGGKEISDEEACDFLNRILARISLLELLLHSTSQRKLLMKILSGAHVEQHISLDSF